VIFRMTMPPSPLFDQPKVKGTTFDPALDGPRPGRQLADVRRVMGFGQWLTLAEIATITGAPEASVSARLRDLRRPEHGGHEVKRRRRGEAKRGLFEYSLTPPMRAEGDGG